MPAKKPAKPKTANVPLAAITARAMALEGAVAALAPSDPKTQALVLNRYDAFTRQLVDRFIGLPIGDTFIDILRESVSDIRDLLALDHSQEEGLPEP